MALVSRISSTKASQVLAPDSLVQSGSLTTGTITATVSGTAYAATLSGLTAQNLYYCYLRMNGGSLGLFFVTTVPSVYRVSFPEAILVGAFYTNTSSQFNGFISNSSVTPSTMTRITAVGSGTYNVPPKLIALRITCVSGGGGGAGAGSNGPGSDGAATWFGSTGLINCNPGGGGFYYNQGGAGGSAQVSAPAVLVRSSDGNAGGGGGGGGGQAYSAEGSGGSAGILGGGGKPSGSGAAAANSGAGGGGAPSANYAAGSGGGGGSGSISMIYAIDLATSYSYQLGDGGNGGVGSQATGGKGGSGLICVEEVKPNLEQLSIL